MQWIHTKRLDSDAKVIGKVAMMDLSLGAGSSDLWWTAWSGLAKQLSQNTVPKHMLL